jgi:predicted transcriptional regulator
VSIVEFVKAYRELVKKIGTGDALTLSSVIFRSPNRARVFLDLCDKGTTTAQDIMERLDVTETTTYRILGDLKELEVIEIAEKVRRS